MTAKCFGCRQNNDAHDEFCEYKNNSGLAADAVQRGGSLIRDKLLKENKELKGRIDNGIGCMKALIGYAEFFEKDIDPTVVKTEAGEAILRLKGEYAKT